MLDKAYMILYIAVFVVFAILAIFCLIRAIIGPRVCDRLVAGNMIVTIVIMVIAILSAKMKEGYLADVCLVYAMVSFIANIVLSRVYIKDKDDKRKIELEKKKEDDAHGMA